MPPLTAPRPGLDWSRVTVRTVGFVPAVCDVFTDVNYHDGSAGEYVELRLPYRQTVELVAPPTIPAPLAPPVEVEPVAAPATADAAGGGTPIRGPGPKKRTAPGFHPGGPLQDLRRHHAQRKAPRVPRTRNPRTRNPRTRNSSYARVYPIAAAC